MTYYVIHRQDGSDVVNMLWDEKNGQGRIVYTRFNPPLVLSVDEPLWDAVLEKFKELPEVVVTVVA